MPKRRYFIERVLNNNSILIKGTNNHTKILTGKGIGFNQKANTFTEIEDYLIEKSFFNYDETLKNQLIDLITNFDENIIQVSNQIITLAEKKFGELNTHVYISLTDHLSFALDRLKNNQIITNPFQSSIQLLLFEEYEIALQAREIIEEKFSVLIPDEEVGFIAFHLNAARENIKVNYVVQEMRIYKAIIQMIETEFKIELESTKCADLYLIIQAYVKQKALPLQFLIENVKLKQYSTGSKKYNLLKKIVDYIENQTDRALTNKQKLVLTAYIEYII
ncbi:MAG: PRD domain-containing protein [Tenericutes bacterium]|nr:PRD domain-containing protein [Mycoplasmatota bacterium]